MTNNTFDLNKFNKAMCSYGCKNINDRALDLFRFIFSIKLNDIFGRSFTVNDRLNKAKVISGVNFNSMPDNLLSFYEILLRTSINYNPEYVIVFNSDITLPSDRDSFIGFYEKSTLISSMSDYDYNNINDRLKFNFNHNDYFCIAKESIINGIKMYDLMIQRSISGSKTVMQKQGTDLSNSRINSFMSNFTGSRDVAEAQAFNENEPTSVLTVPTGTSITFPQAQTQEIDRSYVRAMEWIQMFGRIPATKLFGQTPSGFQTTGNLDILSYEQSLDEIFERFMKPILVDISELMNVPNEVSAISYYKLKLLEDINMMRSTTNSNQIIELCDDYITAISGKKSKNDDIIENNDDIISVDDDLIVY